MISFAICGEYYCSCRVPTEILKDSVTSVIGSIILTITKGDSTDVAGFTTIPFYYEVRLSATVISVSGVPRYVLYAVGLGRVRTVIPFPVARITCDVCVTERIS